MGYLPFLLILFTFLIEGPIGRSLGLIVRDLNASELMPGDLPSLQEYVVSYVKLDKKWHSPASRYRGICDLNYALKRNTSHIGNQCRVLSFEEGNIFFEHQRTNPKLVMVLECSCNGEKSYITEGIEEAQQDIPVYLHLSKGIGSKACNIIRGWMLYPISSDSSGEPAPVLAQPYVPPPQAPGPSYAQPPYPPYPPYAQPPYPPYPPYAQPPYPPYVQPHPKRKRKKKSFFFGFLGLDDDDDDDGGDGGGGDFDGGDSGGGGCGGGCGGG